MTKKKPLPKIKAYQIKDTDYEPRSKAQDLLLKKDFENVFDVCLLGASGVGKTVSLIVSSIGPQNDGTFLTDRPEYRAIFLRRETTLLQRSGLLDAAYMWYKRFYPLVEFNRVEKIFTFPSGAKIQFGGCEQESDKEKYKGYVELHAVLFEELTQFSQPIFDFIVSRLRTSTDIPLRVRSTTNPGDRHEDWVEARYKYWISKSQAPLEKPFTAKWGQTLYYYSDIDDLVISQEKPEEKHWSFCGIETYINDISPDNDKFMRAQITDPVLRAQLVDGVWGLKSGSGMYFKEEYFTEIGQKSNLCTRVRYWDKAASLKGDFTCGLLLARTHDNKYIIEDCIITKVEAADLKPLIINTAKLDGKTVHIGLEQEGGSSGKEVSYEYERQLRSMGFNVVIDIKTSNQATASKLSRASIVSPLVKEGRFSFLAGSNSWRREFIKQLTSFPTKGIHDDCVDALSGAYILLTTRLPSPAGNIAYSNMAQGFNKVSYQLAPARSI